MRNSKQQWPGDGRRVGTVRRWHRRQYGCDPYKNGKELMDELQDYVTKIVSH
jgi:hypothetical protein